LENIMRNWTIPTEDSGQKLLAFLKKELGDGYSMRGIKTLVENNACSINGRIERFASRVVGKGDKITLNIGPEAPQKPGNSTFDPSKVLFEDSFLLAYNKPPGISSQGVNGLEEVLQKHNSDLRLVHRLDKDTSGVILLAKSREIADKMDEQFRSRSIRKTYLAMVDGVPNALKGHIQNYLGKSHSYQGQSIWAEKPEGEGKLAVTSWKKLKSSGNSSLLRCYPKTGRTHQIRVHLSGIGHPVLGDYQYGKKFRSRLRPSEHLLHAEELCFAHPITQSEVLIKTSTPQRFTTS
jgi:RluA family pseudouridine synthase